MTKLTIVVEVEDLDPALEDPHEVADQMLDIDTEFEYKFVSAEWE